MIIINFIKLFNCFYNLFRYITTLILIIFFITFNSKYYFEYSFVCVLIMWLLNFIYGFLKFYKRLNYIFFLISFFCFLMGKLTVNLFTKGTIGVYFSKEIISHILICIFLSLLFLQVGFEFFERFKKVSNTAKMKIKDISYNYHLQKYSKVLFYISSCFAILINIEQGYFIYQNSYLELYTKFFSKIPRVLQVIGNGHLVLLFIYLSTKPNKKSCIFSIFIFLIINFSLLMTGDRGMFAVNIIVVIIYMLWRQNLEREVWISKKVIISGVIFTPIIIAGMSMFVYFREGISVGEMTFSSQFIRFFKITGKTVDLLGYGKKYLQNFPQQFYSFGELIDYIKYNPISQVLLGYEKSLPHTLEYATTMHSYSHIISYFVNSKAYLIGHGEGSSYIAEIYHDFGYIGIIICNTIYGIFLSLLYKLKGNRPILLAMYFIGMRIIFYVPRGPMILPISYIMNITVLTFLIGIHLEAKYQPYLLKKLKLSRKENNK